MEPAHPQAVAQNHHAGMAGLVFFRKDVAPAHGRDAERREKARRDHQTVERLRRGVGVARKVENGVAIDADGFQGARAADDLLRVIPKHPIPAGLFLHARILAAQKHELFGMRVRQRVDQHGFDAREHYRRRADAERDRQQGDHGWSRCAPEEPESDSDVLQHRHPFY